MHEPTGLAQLATKDVLGEVVTTCERSQSLSVRVFLQWESVGFCPIDASIRGWQGLTSGWWKDLDIRNKLPFVRDRLIEGYFWILGIYFEPQHSRTRMFLIKTSMWLVVLDDTFDNYGTYEELEMFTQAVERWSISCLDKLPDYMKLIYQEQLSVHQEMEESLEKEGKVYQIHYIREMAKEYTRSLLLEAKWVKEGYMPTLDEFMSNSLVTCGYALMTARSYVARDDDLVTEDAFKWLATHPPLVKATCKILRLMNDIATHKEEQERVHIASSIECYRKETGASEEEACEFFLKQVEDAWKVMNRESLRPTNVPFPLVIPPINLARVIDTLYKDNDGYKHAGKEVVSYIKSSLSPYDSLSFSTDSSGPTHDWSSSCPTGLSHGSLPDPAASKVNYVSAFSV
ncbi:(E)-beta-farnesene synthase-like protein [Tanacetum coccineum]|uniref:(E)-beta-farnesene synthase-like protein n=1 Tax=Tanacetum coccineum TaxID=301880 RepID=A0ABQ4ZIL2_9ASTR